MRGGADEDVPEISGIEVKMDIPVLYKYREFNETLVISPSGEQVPRWQQDLYYGIISPAPPECFNDPYDSDLIVDNSFLNQKVARELYIDTLVEKQVLSESEKELLRTATDWKAALESIMQTSLSSDFADDLMNSVNQTFQILKKEFRIACFSATKDSILMWSHYAKNHTGFCIEYDFHSSKLAQHLHPVRYTKGRKFIPGSFADQDNAAANQAIYEAALYKSEKWSYEEEWRCVLHEKVLNQFNPLPFDISRFAFNILPYINAVYLGAKTAEKYRSQICDHYKGTNVKVFQMELMPDCYELNPRRLQ